MNSQHDIVIAGSGPAGLAAAAACVQAGLSVAVVSPNPLVTWPNGYGIWPDEIADPELAKCTSVVWDRLEVRFGDRETNHVQRTYARVDNEALQGVLLDRAAGVKLIRGEAGAVVHDSTGSTLSTSQGDVRARVVIDATGGGLLLGAGVPTSFQTAWGVVVDTDDLDPSMPRWMDHTPIPGSEASFLYALPLGGSRWLLEETCLVRQPEVALDVLRARLRLRLEQYQVRISVGHGIERVRIPMNQPLPRRQRVVGFGAAGAMIHPSTGYLLARVLADAPKLAAALAAHSSPEAASNAAWETLWPADRVRQRALHLYGAEVIGRLDPVQTAQFFRSFFGLPPATTRAWLADALPPDALVSAMASMFSTLSPRLRWKAASGGKLRHLVNAAIGRQP